MVVIIEAIVSVVALVDIAMVAVIEAILSVVALVSFSIASF